MENGEVPCTGTGTVPVFILFKINWYLQGLGGKACCCNTAIGGTMIQVCVLAFFLRSKIQKPRTV